MLSHFCCLPPHSCAQAIIRKDRAGRRRQHDAHDPALPQDDEAGPLEWRGEQPSTAPLQQQQQQQQPRPRLPASPTSPASSLSAPPPAAFKAAGSSSSSSRAAGVAGGGGSSGGRKLTPLSAEVARVASPAASGRRPAGNALEHAVAEALNWRSDSLQLAGGEVGLWMCLAFSLEVAGLQVRWGTGLGGEVGLWMCLAFSLEVAGLQVRWGTGLGGEVGLWMCLAFSLEVAGRQVRAPSHARISPAAPVLLTGRIVEPPPSQRHGRPSRLRSRRARLTRPLSIVDEQQRRSTGVPPESRVTFPHLRASCARPPATPQPASATKVCLRQPSVGAHHADPVPAAPHSLPRSLLVRSWPAPPRWPSSTRCRCW